MIKGVFAAISSAVLMSNIAAGQTDLPTVTPEHGRLLVSNTGNRIEIVFLVHAKFVVASVTLYSRDVGTVEFRSDQLEPRGLRYIYAGPERPKFEYYCKIQPETGEAISVGSAENPFVIDPAQFPKAAQSKKKVGWMATAGAAAAATAGLLAAILAGAAGGAATPVPPRSGTISGPGSPTLGPSK
jgi:hypothetical protein